MEKDIDLKEWNREAAPQADVQEAEKAEAVTEPQEKAGKQEAGGEVTLTFQPYGFLIMVNPDLSDLNREYRIICLLR